MNKPPKKAQRSRKQLFDSIKKTVTMLKAQKTTILDLKMIDASLRELRKTSKVFAPFHRKRKVTVFGSARLPATDPSYIAAKKFAKEISNRGFMVMTGAGPGIMQAAHEGAGASKSIGLNIKLPFEQSANPIIQGDAKLVNYKYFFNRKLTMIKESDALVLFPGGFGTQDELFETLTLLQTGKTAPTPVICMDQKGGTYWKEWRKFNLDILVKRKLISKEDIGLIYFTNNIKESADKITKFFHNYHSIRYLKEWLLIRVWRTPSQNDLKKISKKFKSMMASGVIEIAQRNLPYDPDLSELKLKTLKLHFNQRSFGRVKELIDQLNNY